MELVVNHSQQFDAMGTNRILENIIEMSREFQNLHQRQSDLWGNASITAGELAVLGFNPEIDSRDLITLMPQWALEFEISHPLGYYDEESDSHQKYIRDYYGDIECFVLDKLKEVYPL